LNFVIHVRSPSSAAVPSFFEDVAANVTPTSPTYMMATIHIGYSTFRPDTYSIHDGSGACSMTFRIVA
jgi:hypothetical protein